MKYTDVERQEALTLSSSNHTIAGALKALTLSNLYPTLKAKIYDNTSALQVRLNELSFIHDYDKGEFELAELPSRWVLKLEDNEGSDYFIYKGAFEQISQMYAHDSEVFDYNDGFDTATIERYQDALGGEFVEVC